MEAKGYSLYKSSKNFNRNSPVHIELAKDYDEYGYISQELGEELDNLFEEGYVIGIHRTGYTYIQPNPNDVNLKNIFNHGLYNNGDVMGGARISEPSIEKTVSIYNNSILLNGAIKTTDKYKNSTGCIIVKIPESYVRQKDGPIMPIYYKSEHCPMRLLPEFIYGYIPVENHTAKYIIRNINYQDKHNKVTEQSYYESEVSNACKRKNIYLPKVESISIKDKFNLLTSSYIITLRKYGLNQALGALKALINNHTAQYFSGQTNRDNLIKHVAYENITKVLAYGLNVESNQLENLINLFQEYINDSIKRNNTQQK